MPKAIKAPLASQGGSRRISVSSCSTGSNSNSNDNTVNVSTNNGIADARKWIVPGGLGISRYFSLVMYMNWHHWGFIQWSNSTLESMQSDQEEYLRSLNVLLATKEAPPQIKKRVKKILHKHDQEQFLRYARERAKRKSSEHAINATRRAIKAIVTAASDSDQ
ncbi:hypothetical protein BGZ80_010917 [Entomortierella chlamydospora]|uniref:Uncharacterized protein n=1 Tax=Entomortierella chlamydospora TaxID=101097 RepID=A0A9P6MUZ5_9FUNG|nr:hypothetical protein BGZ79_002063 [Entomortierella chlamydospora]KAG0013687.1 hypothetical protein BGZ80_010917 [Entomortierella chlamydospora]